jgi:hypothetical protein
MCMGGLPLMKKAGINPMWAVSPGLAALGVGKKKKPDKPVVQPQPMGSY